MGVGSNLDRFEALTQDLMGHLGTDGDVL